jgi:hypothetical protein
MITPMYRFGLVLWVEVQHAHYSVPFLCLGEHGPYCRIEYGGV